MFFGLLSVDFPKDISRTYLLKPFLGQIVDQIFGQVFDHIFDQGFGEGQKP